MTLMTGFVVQGHKWSVGHQRCFTSVFNAEATNKQAIFFKHCKKSDKTKKKKW